MQELNVLYQALEAFNRRISELEIRVKKFEISEEAPEVASAPSSEEQAELSAKTQNEVAPATSQQTVAQSQPEQEDAPIEAPAEPTAKDKISIRDRAAKLLAMGPSIAGEFRNRITSGELTRPSEITTWDEYEVLDFFLTSKGC